MPPITVTITEDTWAAIQTDAAGIAGSGTASGGGTPASPPPTVDYFPANPGLAPFPSPDNSTSMIVNNAISGAPYLRDSEGMVWAFETPPVLSSAAIGMTYDPGHSWYFDINGVRKFGATELIVRNGQVYFHEAQVWFNWGPNGGTQEVTLPPPAGSTPTPPVAVVMPPDPPAPSVAMGSGITYLIGAAHPSHKIADALPSVKPGDVILLDAGTYAESVVIPPGVTIRGQPITSAGTWPTIIDGTSLAGAYVYQGRGGLVPTGDCTLENLEITGFGMLSKTADLTYAIRPADTGGWLQVNNCHIHGCQGAVATDTYGGTGNYWVVEITGGIFEQCGLGDGSSHNVYVGNSTARIVATNLQSINPLGGHAFKTRAHGLTIIGGTMNASDATPIDIPDGTAVAFTISSLTLNKASGDANHGLIGYCTESESNGTAGGTITGSTINAACQSPFLQIVAGTVALSGNTFTGNPVTNQGGGTVTGLP